MAPADFRLGDVVRLKKRHPCGGEEWAVVRLGADIGLRCLKCQRRVLVGRAALERQMKSQDRGGGDGAPDNAH